MKQIQNVYYLRRVDLKSGKELKAEEEEDEQDHTNSKILKEDMKNVKIKCSIVL